MNGRDGPRKKGCFMKKLLGGMTFGLAAMALVACGDSSSAVSLTSSESLQETDYLTIDKDNQVVTYLTSAKGVCLLDNHKIEWNSDPLSSVASFKYEISKDTLYWFNRSLDKPSLDETGFVFTGDSKSVKGTWKFTDCTVKRDDGDKVVKCKTSKNKAVETYVTISGSSIITDIKQNPNYNFGYSEFVHDILNILDNDYKLEDVTGDHLFESSDENFDHFSEEHSEKFKSINNKTAEFAIGQRKFEFVLDTAFSGIPSSMASVRVISEGDTCAFNYEYAEMTKSYCKDKYSENFDESVYFDADDEKHDIASAYRNENVGEFAKCLRNMVKEEASKEDPKKEEK